MDEFSSQRRVPRSCYQLRSSGCNNCGAHQSISWLVQAASRKPSSYVPGYWFEKRRLIIPFAPSSRYLRKAMKFLAPTVEERLKAPPRDQKPDDLIQWLIDVAPPIEKTVFQLVERIMALNVGSIHTTTMVRITVTYEEAHSNLHCELLDFHRSTLQSCCRTR